MKVVEHADKLSPVKNKDFINALIMLGMSLDHNDQFKLALTFLFL